MAQPAFFVRHLKEEELPRWFDHLAECFPNTGKHYFELHWAHDVDRSVERIFVVMDVSSGEIASTVKVYLRTIWVQGVAVKCAAIGEVSTKERYRKQGFAAQLLAQAVSVSTAQWGTVLSILRSSKFASFYAKLGWVPVPQLTASIAPTRDALQQRINADLARGLTGAASFVKLDPNHLDQWADCLCASYNAYSKHFNGPVVRTPQYYMSWIMASFRLYPGAFIAALDKEDHLLGYLILQTPNAVVSEFIPVLSLSHECRTLLLAQLLRNAMGESPLPDGCKLSLSSPLTSHLPPSTAKDDPLRPVDFDSNSANMYRLLVPDQLPTFKVPESLTGSRTESQHAFFPSDSY